MRSCHAFDAGRRGSVKRLRAVFVPLRQQFRRVTPAVTLLLFAVLAPQPGSAASSFPASQRQHWAFQKVKRPALPKAAASEWVRNPLDVFVLEKLRGKGIHPGPPADKIALIRRASFDLIGLPPTPEEVRAFLEDDSPNAFEKVLDRLLASPNYGERWARHWLDLARYAESNGFRGDESRPNAWRYRDYVIKALLRLLTRTNHMIALSASRSPATN